ncbi:prefoldin subunit 4 isoform X2 [Syngnathoides biaculeatus]|uniref:prefoldin subunit 4 isoform X2 n=1 Tax=Syngnathoides biaculeatus TaxID=300417 RepID=UPI002ADD89CE|nr:prefoldin subunit 4 isoform X2 [Syngnathoides biaculeatus]
MGGTVLLLSRFPNSGLCSSIQPNGCHSNKSRIYLTSICGTGWGLAHCMRRGSTLAQGALFDPSAHCHTVFIDEQVKAKMAATMKGPVGVEDVNVTFEDQQKINKFARSTNRMTELKKEIESKKKSLQNLQDASDDLMMFDDDSLLIPYQIGDVFISHTQEETQEMLEAAKEALEQEVKELDERVSAIQQLLSDLKVQLYAKFGNNINLEADES